MVIIQVKALVANMPNRVSSPPQLTHRRLIWFVPPFFGINGDFLCRISGERSILEVEGRHSTFRSITSAAHGFAMKMGNRLSGGTHLWRCEWTMHNEIVPGAEKKFPPNGSKRSRKRWSA